MINYYPKETMAYTVNGKTFHIDRDKMIVREASVLVAMNEKENPVMHRITLYANGEPVIVLERLGYADENIMSDADIVARAIAMAKSGDSKQFIAAYDKKKSEYGSAGLGKIFRPGKYGKIKTELDKDAAEYRQIMTALEHLEDLQALYVHIEQLEQAKHEEVFVEPVVVPEEIPQDYEGLVDVKSAPEYSIDTLRAESEENLKALYTQMTGNSAEGLSVEEIIAAICGLTGIEYEPPVVEKPKSVAMQRWNARMAKVKAEQERRANNQKQNGGSNNQPNGPAN